MSQFLVVLSRLMGILAKRLPRLLRLGAGHKNTPGIPRVGAASRQRSCTYSLMRQGLCQLSYSDMEPHLFRFSLLAAVLPSPHTWDNAAWLSVVSQLLSVCVPSGSRMGATQLVEWVEICTPQGATAMGVKVGCIASAQALRSPPRLSSKLT